VEERRRQDAPSSNLRSRQGVRKDVVWHGIRARTRIRPITTHIIIIIEIIEIRLPQV
jgi:hypothetical protein